MDKLKKLLKQKNIKLYANDEVLEKAPIEKMDDLDVEYFKVGKDISCDELAEEYEKRGLIPCCIEDLIKSDKDDVAIQWKDGDRKWCYAVFVRDVGERRLIVRRGDDDWHDGWWFCGIKKEPFNKPKVALRKGEEEIIKAHIKKVTTEVEL